MINASKSVFRRMSIGAKLLAGFGVVLALTLAVSATSVASFMSIDHGITETVANAEVADEGAMTARIALGDAQWAEGAFVREYPELGLEEAQSIHIDRALGDLEEVRHSLDEIAEVADDDMAALVASASETTDAYAAALTAVVNQYVARGHVDTGAEGVLRASVHEIEEVVTAAELPVLEADMLTLRRNEKDYILRGTSKYVDKLHGNVEVFKADVAASGLPSSTQSELITLVDQYQADFDAYVAANDVLTSAQAELDANAEELVGYLIAIEEIGAAAKETATSSLHDTAGSAERTAIGISALAIVFGLAVAFFLSRSISKRVKAVGRMADRLAVGDTEADLDVKDSGDEIGAMVSSIKSTVAYLQDASDVADKIAQGDLTTSFEPRSDEDRLGNALTVMISKLNEVMNRATQVSKQVQDGSSVLAASAEESARAASDVASSIGGVADNASTQAQTVGSVASAVGQIVEDLAATAEAVTAATDSAREATTAADAGQAQIDQANKSMKAITASFGQVSETVNELGVHSEKVEEIVDIIRSIAEQTNLLALNAAIEAARAGELGRGFAVVASEVKSLAEESALSTEQIASIVGQMRSSVSETIVAMDEGRTQVTEGSEVVDAAGAAFVRIGGAVTDIRTKVAGVSDAAGRIQGAVNAIESGAASLSEVSETNSAASGDVAAASQEAAATSEEIGATAQELAMSADQLAQAMALFAAE